MTLIIFYDAVVQKTMVNNCDYFMIKNKTTTISESISEAISHGKEVLIRNWDENAVKSWHLTHYRPDNVSLYIVGDIIVEDAEKVFWNKFGHIPEVKHATEMDESVKPRDRLLADAIMDGTVNSFIS